MRRCANALRQADSHRLIDCNPRINSDLKTYGQNIWNGIRQLTASTPARNPEQDMAVVNEYGCLFAAPALMKHRPAYRCLVRGLEKWTGIRIVSVTRSRATC
jgi:hypothetical protein